ncbi:MAG: hypothetical protein M3R04_09350, partial [bacterium]|nr:hypothetical protein [bacterium]
EVGSRAGPGEGHPVVKRGREIKAEGRSRARNSSLAASGYRETKAEIHLSEPDNAGGGRAGRQHLGAVHW